MLNFGLSFVVTSSFRLEDHLQRAHEMVYSIFPIDIYLTLIVDKNKKCGKLDLPQTYNRSYRIPFSVVPADLAYKLRTELDRRPEKRKDKRLTMDHLHEVRTVLRHFLHFKQKQKVYIARLL